MPKPNSKANIHSFDEYLRMERSVEVLIVDSNTCNENCCALLDLSSFSNLKVFEVGDYTFSYVNEVKLIGLNRLERVVMGRHCFSSSFKKNPDRHFYLKNCEKLRELKIGIWSFIDYSVCEIENVPSLEGIELGEWSEWSRSFSYASLELKSDFQRMKS